MYGNNGSTVFMEIKDNYNDFKIYSTKKLIIFSKPKVATRFLSALLNVDEDSSKFSFSDNLEINTKFQKSSSKVGTGDTRISYYDIFDKNKNKKEIILLYRDPYQRFITGLLQGTIWDIFHRPPAFSLLLDNFTEYKTPIDILIAISYRNIYKHDGIYRGLLNSITITDEMITDSNEFIDRLLNRLCTYYTIAPFPDDVHILNYLHIYNTIINSSNIDANKITLINIDDTNTDLHTILTSMDDTIIPRTNIDINSNGSVKKRLKLILEKNIILRDKVYKHLQMDYYFYNLFENSKLNILNKK